MLVGVVVVVTLLATVSAGAADSSSADTAQFDQTLERFQQWYLGEYDERGVVWQHWRFQVDGAAPQRASRETDYLRVGQGVQRATLIGERNAEPGWSLDVLHPTGSAADFVMVGDAYRRPARPGELGPRGPLVATPWIARPAKGADRWSPCITSATRLFCDIDQALARSRTVVPGLPRWVETNADGSRSARTAIRLVDLVAQGNDPLDDRMLAQAAPLLQMLVPLTITETAGGQFLRAQFGGRLQGSGVRLEIDDGLEFRGLAFPEDIPRAPVVRAEVTVMDELAYGRFAADAASRSAS